VYKQIPAENLADGCFESSKADSSASSRNDKPREGIDAELPPRISFWAAVPKWNFPHFGTYRKSFHPPD
jgi:hypothetical protein